MNRTSFIYLSLWPYSIDEWLSIAAIDDGLTLCRWGDAQVRAAWTNMNETDKAAVDNHRSRSFGRNPIDWVSDQDPPDIGRLLSSSGL